MKILLAPDAAEPATLPTGTDLAPEIAGAGDQPPISKGFFEKLDALGAEPKPSEAEPKPADAPAGEPAKPAEKPNPAPAAADPKLTPIEPGPKEPKELRKAHDRAVFELKSEREARQKLEQRISVAESKGKDTEALAKQLADVTRERDERIAEIRRVTRANSPEFVSKYEAPFNQAAAQAEALIKTMKVITGKDAEDNPVTRDAQFEDLQALFNMPRGHAIEKAFELFGNRTGPVIVSTLSDLWRLNDARKAAHAQELAGYDAQEKESQAKQATERQANEEMWKAVNADIASKNPEWFSPDAQKDPAEKKLLTEGFALVDSQSQGMSVADRAVLQATIRNRAAAYELSKLRLTKAEARITELETALASAKGSKPGGGPVGGGRGSESGGNGPGNSKSILQKYDETFAVR